MSETAVTRLIIGFSRGSLSDRIARALVAPLSLALGKEVVVESMPGENGQTAARTVAEAQGDGSVLFIATLGTHALARHINHALPYDPLHDFKCVSLIAQAPLLLACHPDVGARSAADVIRLAKARPGELTYATSAIGGAPHLAAALFQHIACVTLKHVCYAETERLYRDLEAGRVSLSFNNVVSMLPRCNGGTLRPLGVTAASRMAIAPDVPTLGESGVPGYEVTNWVGIVAPASMPARLVEQLSSALRDVVQTDELRDAWQKQGIVARGTSHVAFAAFVAREIERWGRIAGELTATAEHVH